MHIRPAAVAHDVADGPGRARFACHRRDVAIGRNTPGWNATNGRETREANAESRLGMSPAQSNLSKISRLEVVMFDWLRRLAYITVSGSMSNSAGSTGHRIDARRSLLQGFPKIEIGTADLQALAKSVEQHPYPGAVRVGRICLYDDGHFAGVETHEVASGVYPDELDKSPDEMPIELCAVVALQHLRMRSVGCDFW